MKSYISLIRCASILVLLGACQSISLEELKKNTAGVLNLKEKPKILRTVQKNESLKIQSLGEVLNGSLNSVMDGNDFKTSIRYAIEKDPVVLAGRLGVEARTNSVKAVLAQKEFQVTGTVYGGIEDVTDDTKGVAFALNASRPVFDGGMLDAQIASERFKAESAKYDLRATLDNRVLRLAVIWVEYEKYVELKQKIDSRLAVLDPLISQLEKVARAGIGDVSKVTAAQRTVSIIRVAEANVSERLSQAQVEFENAFGSLPNNMDYDADFISKLVPSKISDSLIESAPLLQSQYAAYKASAADVQLIESKDSFDVGLEARVMRPFAGSGYDSDESIGIVARKMLYNGGMFESELKEATANLDAIAADMKTTYREGARTIRAAQQNIVSMDSAIMIARNNAELTASEIEHLKQQLIIGASTLESVLAAEARLYDAQTKEVEYRAEKQKSELNILASLGLLAPAFDL